MQPRRDGVQVSSLSARGASSRGCAVSARPPANVSMPPLDAYGVGPSSSAALGNSRFFGIAFDAEHGRREGFSSLTADLSRL